MLEMLMKEIDEKETKRMTIKALKAHRLNMLSVDIKYLPKTTATYTLEPRSVTNTFSSSTENVIYMIDEQRAREKSVREVSEKINRLNCDSRAIIIETYLQREKPSVTNICEKLSMSERDYHKKKSDALIQLAYVLRLVEYQ